MQKLSLQDKKRFKTEIAKPLNTPTTDANVGPVDDNEDEGKASESPNDCQQDASNEGGTAGNDSDEDISTASENEGDTKSERQERPSQSRSLKKSRAAGDDPHHYHILISRFGEQI